MDQTVGSRPDVVSKVRGSLAWVPSSVLGRKLKILTVQSGTCAVSFALMGPSPSACPSPGRGTLGPGSV